MGPIAGATSIIDQTTKTNHSTTVMRFLYAFLLVALVAGSQAFMLKDNIAEDKLESKESVEQLEEDIADDEDEDELEDDDDEDEDELEDDDEDEDEDDLEDDDDDEDDEELEDDDEDDEDDLEDDEE